MTKINKKLVEKALNDFADGYGKAKQRLTNNILKEVKNEDLLTSSKEFVEVLKSGVGEKYFGGNIEEGIYKLFLETISNPDLSPDDIEKNYSLEQVGMVQAIITAYMCVLQEAIRVGDK